MLWYSLVIIMVIAMVCDSFEFRACLTRAVASYRHSVDLADNAKPFKIGSWVVAQRKEKAMGRMDPEKANLLQKLVEEG